MKRSLLSIVISILAMSVMAVPADPRLLKELLAKGDTARYEQMVNGSRIVNSRRPAVGLREQAMRRAAQVGARKEFGVSPLMASRGLLILANFSDKSFQTDNTQAQMDSMMNAYSYTYNGATGSSAQYFSDQSNGQYRPHFDVVGPITLPKGYAYYGKNDAGGEDEKSGDLVLHACSIASQINGVNLADYDADGDGEMDFVYIIYAGYGEAQGAPENTIWPASWDMASAVATGYTSLSKTAKPSQYTFDGVSIGNFAYSQELDGKSGSTRSGIGTPTHEFSHVLGLPDFYDTNYGTNYENSKTPGDWDVMDGGSYNNDGKTPPNMSPWEKAFMGWLTPVNLGNNGQNVTLYANGTSQYVAYQINSSGMYQDYKTSGICYYIENRQNLGWDKSVPGHGMLIWKVNYNQTAWENNEPNNTAGNCRYTVVSASGKTTGIGSGADPFPGTGRKTSWSGISSKPISDIQESNQMVNFKYMGGAPACEGYSVSFVSAVATMTADAGFNADCVVAGMDFEGSFQMNNGYVYDSVVVTMGGRVLSEDDVEYMADESGIIVSEIRGDVIITLYGHRNGGGEITDVVADTLFASDLKATGGSYMNFSNVMKNSGAVYAGNSATTDSAIQLRTKNSNSGIVTTGSGGKLQAVKVRWNANTTDGREVVVYSSSEPFTNATELYSISSSSSIKKLGSIACDESAHDGALTITTDCPYVGVRSSSGALYMDCIIFVWGRADFTPTPTLPEESECPEVRKIFRDGQIVVSRDGMLFDLLGRKL